MSLSIGSLHSAASSPVSGTTGTTGATAANIDTVMTWETSGCPSPPFDGWMHTSDCTTYYWCKEGKRASLDYTCPGGQLFDEAMGRCDNAVDVVCSGGAVVDIGGAGSSEGGSADGGSTDDDKGGDGGLGQYLSQVLHGADPNADSNSTSDSTSVNATATATATANSDPNSNANAISQDLLEQQAHWASLNRPLLTPAELTILKTHPDITLILGPPIYFPSVADTACYSVYDLNPPDWMDALQMFELKYDCCQTTFQWMDLDTCLGPGFVEINYQVEAPFAPTSVPSAAPTLSAEPTRSPTDRPTDSVAPTASPVERPTAVPSSSPTEEGTDVPSTMPSHGPTTSPTMAPSASPSTSEPTGRPTSGEPTTAAPSRSPVRVNFVVEKLRDGGGTAGGGEKEGVLPLAAEYFAEYFSVGSMEDGGIDGADSHEAAMDETEDAGAPMPTPTPTLPPAPSLPTNVTLSPLADATISKHRPDLNFGNNPKLAVDAGSSPSDAANGIYVETFETLLQFDLSSVPLPFSSSSSSSSREGQIERIDLELFSQSKCAAGARFYYLTSSARAISKWKEEDITWSTAPEPTGGDRYVVSTTEAGTEEWSAVDLTAVVLSTPEEDHGPGLVTIRIRASPQSDLRDRCVYSSKEDGGGDRAPRLVVRYAVPTALEEQDAVQEGQLLDEESLLQPPSDEKPAASTSSAGDPLLLMAMEAPLPPLTQTHIYAHPLPPSASGDFTLLRAIDDATVHLTHPSNSYGTLPVLAIQFDTYRRNIMDCLIRFDIRTLWQKKDAGADAVDAARTLPGSAMLTLFAMGDCAAAGTIVATTTRTRRLSDGEVITLGAWSQEEVNWNNAPSAAVIAADVRGKEGDEEEEEDAAVFRIGTFGSVSANSWYGFDVVDAVRWAVGKRKEEITFRMSGNDERQCEFASLESGRAPKLMVVFR
eukprot:CAMPEP_0171428632 /NCGR_PEP_ID=MMETSP0881-20121228/5374_1 /TAXON_ID=67004 /ORGANISM="Thalassiosira weissflogii, Strain CCMP1336" /LENGTH=933 /DNA_ID=CAMNT_0011948455 /DNA_START=156 /DNA_END=2957 /DNA_ORIENTATION=-